MKKFIYVIPILAIVLLGTGCSNTAQNNNVQQTANDAKKKDGSLKNVGTKESLAKNSDGAHGATLAGTRIEFQNINNLKPGDITLAFKLYGRDAHKFGPDDLKVTHEKPLHLMLVRDDLQYYQHLHPEFVDGNWTVKTQVAEQGKYEMYVDIDPKEENPIVLRVPLTIGGATKEKMFPTVSRDLTAIVDGITASLDKAELGRKTTEITLRYKLTQNSQPLSQIQAYLGAFGHVVALKHGEPDHFVHAHPLTETVPQNGIVEFEINLQEKGMYTIFAQFNINGKIKTFPITLEAEGFAAVQKMEENKHMQ